jgi:hypothetical protein
VFVNDTWYRIYDDRQYMVQEPDATWTYLGDIQSVVPGVENPTENFQANFEQIGARIYHNYEAHISVNAGVWGEWPPAVDGEVIGDSIIVVFEGQRTMFISEQAHAEVLLIMQAVKRDSLFIDGNIYSLMSSSDGTVIDLDDEHFIGEVQSFVSVNEYPTENLQANREHAVGAKVYRLPAEHIDDIVIFHFPGGYNFYSLLPGYAGVEEEQVSPYSINTTVFMYLGKTPEEVTDLAGEHIETIWFSGWWHKFGDYWFVFDDDEHPTGQSIYLFCELSDIVDGITSGIDVSELDKLFGQQAIFSTVENSELFSVGYLQYEYQGIEISIDAEPNARIGKDAFVRLRIL